MKSGWIFAIVVSLLLSVAGSGTVLEASAKTGPVATYADIPGITEEEIAAIEALREKRDSFVCGSLPTTAAFPLPDGTYAGFLPRACELLTSIFGVEFVLELCEWDDLIDRLGRGSLDFTSELTATTQRMERYYMTHPIAELRFGLYNHKNSEEIRTEEDLEGLRVGFLKGVITADLIREKYPVSFEQVEVATHKAAAEMLETGEIDAFVELSTSDRFFAEYDFIRSRRMFSLLYGPVSLTTANPELQPVISAVNKYLASGGVDRFFECFQEGEREYARYTLNKSFTEEERAYLDDLAARGAKVPVAVENENYPVSFYNRTDQEYQGFALDILAEISDLTGIEFEAVTEKDTLWPEILDKLKTGEASMVTQLLYTDARKDDYLWSSVPYTSSHYALLSKLDDPELAGYQVIRAAVGFVEQTGHADIYREWFPDSGNTVAYATYQDALTALEKGEIDLLMASEYTLLHQTNYREKAGFKANIRFGAPLESRFGFHKGETVLCSVIDKTLPYINTGVITRKWTDRVFDYSRAYADSLSQVLSFFIVVLSFALVLVASLWLKNKRFRQELERKTMTLSTIFTSIPDLLFSKDANCKYTSCNPSFIKLAGCEEAEILGRTALEVFAHDEEMAHRFMREDEKAIGKNTVQVMEEWYTYPDGTRKLFESVKAPLVQDGTVIGVMGISRDITEHKAAEEAAQAASKAKSAFLARMSHEIRTPMNAIEGMSELILRENIPPGIHEHVLSIKHASANLLTIINDILDFSKIEAGKFEISQVEYSFAPLLQDVLSSIRVKAIEKSLLFTADIDSNIPGKLLGDEARIRQVFLNLLGNSVRHTEEGFIALQVSAQLGENTVVLTIGISDSGTGGNEEEMDNLFGEFVRLDKGKNKEIQGTGLGLAIAKNLCELMGGDILIESECGVGNIITATLPQSFCTYEKCAAVPDPEEKQVLVYDTCSRRADSIVRSGMNLGVRCTLVTGEPEFHEELRRTPYPFVFVPSALSESAARVMKRLHVTAKPVFIVESGESPALYKGSAIATPVHALSIANVLNNASGGNFYAESGGGKTYFIAPSASVLVVDDVNTNLKVTKGLLLPYRMQVDVCRSGAEAIQCVREKRYDMIFMDHMMPDMDGIEATKRIRAMEDMDGYCRTVPIIALTANAVFGMKEKFLRSGMDDFLAKPIDIAELNGILGRWIPEEKKEKFVGEREEAALSEAEIAGFDVEGIDITASIASVSGMRDYWKTLAVFHMDGTDKMEKIRACLEQGDIRLYTTYVHALKSASASIGAGKLSELAKRLEIAGEKGDILFLSENTGQFLQELEELLQNINAAIPSGWGADDQEAAESGFESAQAELLRLKEALDNMDAGEVTDIMEVLEAKRWSQKTGELFDRISRDVLLFRYADAAKSVDELLQMGEDTP